MPVAIQYAMSDVMSSAAIFLVDDEPANLKVLSEALSGQGYTLAVATSGQRVLDQVARRQPDLILLDVLMPGMDGFEVCRRLKAHPVTADVPIMFMTFLDDPEDRVRAFEFGAVDYLLKPFHRDELRARIKMHLSLRVAMKALAEKNAELQRAQADAAMAMRELEAMASTLEKVNEDLDQQVLRRTHELLEAKGSLEAELDERRRAEAARQALQQQVLDLSCPIIPITDEILVMPLIGVLDETRARFVTQTALQRVSKRSASVMILDITGVSQVNTTVASAILDTARALQLLGTQTLLTGIRADVARTLVAMDIDFQRIVTLSTLQGGVAHAMRQLEHRPIMRRGCG